MKYENNILCCTTVAYTSQRMPAEEERKTCWSQISFQQITFSLCLVKKHTPHTVHYTCSHSRHTMTTLRYVLRWNRRFSSCGSRSVSGSWNGRNLFQISNFKFRNDTYILTCHCCFILSLVWLKAVLINKYIYILRMLIISLFNENVLFV